MLNYFFAFKNQRGKIHVYSLKIFHTCIKINMYQTLQDVIQNISTNKNIVKGKNYLLLCLLFPYPKSLIECIYFYLCIYPCIDFKFKKKILVLIKVNPFLYVIHTKRIKEEVYMYQFCMSLRSQFTKSYFSSTEILIHNHNQNSRYV